MLLIVHTPGHCVNVGKVMVVGCAPVFVTVRPPITVAESGVTVSIVSPVTVNGWPEAVMVFVLHNGPWHAAMVVKIGATTVVVAMDVIIVGWQAGSTWRALSLPRAAQSAVAMQAARELSHGRVETMTAFAVMRIADSVS